MPVYAEALGTAFRIDATKDKSVILSRDGSGSTSVEAKKDVTQITEAKPPPQKTSKIDPTMIVAGVAGVGLVLAAFYLLRSKPVVPVQSL